MQYGIKIIMEEINENSCCRIRICWFINCHIIEPKNEVIALDILKEKVEKVNKRISPIKDNEIENYFKTKKLKLEATLDWKYALENAELIIICTPTNYDETKNYFDTTSIENIIEKVISLKNKTATIVIKSTVPVGYVDSINKIYKLKNVYFSPEFLREGKALYDNLYPSRIIVGGKTKKAKEFANLLSNAAKSKDVPILYMSNTEAEAVKLFTNTYLALRVAYFNEIDTYAEIKGLSTKNIIKGISLDPRVGDYYNNPSFGYGGYCLPKDTKQLLANFEGIPQNIIEAVVRSNDTRKNHVANMIMKRNPKVVGVYRLKMKKDSDNFRTSAVLGIIKILKENNINVMIYEPTISVNTYEEIEVVHDLKLFKELSDIIITNRNEKEIDDCKEFVYSRDVFTRD